MLISSRYYYEFFNTNDISMHHRKLRSLQINYYMAILKAETEKINDSVTAKQNYASKLKVKGLKLSSNFFIMNSI